jgi:hypothetical protein
MLEKELATRLGPSAPGSRGMQSALMLRQTRRQKRPESCWGFVRARPAGREIHILCVHSMGVIWRLLR